MQNSDNAKKLLLRIIRKDFLLHDLLLFISENSLENTWILYFLQEICHSMLAALC